MQEEYKKIWTKRETFSRNLNPNPEDLAQGHKEAKFFFFVSFFLKASKQGEGSTPTKYTHQKPGYIQEPFGKTTQNNSARERGRGVRKADSLRKRQSGVAAQVRGAMVRLPDNKKKIQGSTQKLPEKKNKILEQSSAKWLWTRGSRWLYTWLDIGWPRRSERHQPQ